MDIDAESGYTIFQNGDGFNVLNKNGDIVLKGNFLRAREAKQYITFAKTGEELGVAGIHASDSYVCWYVESEYPYKLILLSRFCTGTVSVESKECNAVKLLSVKRTYWWYNLMIFPILIFFFAVMYLLRTWSLR